MWPSPCLFFPSNLHLRAFPNSPPWCWAGQFSKTQLQSHHSLIPKPYITSLHQRIKCKIATGITLFLLVFLLKSLPCGTSTLCPSHTKAAAVALRSTHAHPYLCVCALLWSDIPPSASQICSLSLRRQLWSFLYSHGHQPISPFPGPLWDFQGLKAWTVVIYVPVCSPHDSSDCCVLFTIVGIGPSIVTSDEELPKKYLIRKRRNEDGRKGRRTKETSFMSSQHALLDPSTLYLPLKSYLWPRVKIKAKATEGCLGDSVG